MARKKKIPHAAIAADQAEAKRAPAPKPSQRAVSANARKKAQAARSAAKHKTVTSPSEEWNRSRALKKKKAAPVPPKPSSNTNKSHTGTKNTKPTKNKNKKKKGGGAKTVPPTPAPPTVIDPVKIVQTQKPGVPVTGTPYTSNIVEQEQDILNAFLTFSGTELFQYTNSRTIDGMFDDVSIISVLSSRRRNYTPNTIIESVIPIIKNVTRQGDILVVEVERAIKGRRIIMEFYVGSNILEVGSEEYV